MRKTKWESITYRRRYMAEWYRRHKKQANKQSADWAKKNRDILVATARKSKYGLGRKVQELLFKSGCMICTRKATHIDHNHKTGHIRGVLCNNCNIGLGMFADSPRLLLWAAAYLNDEVEHKATKGM